MGRGDDLAGAAIGDRHRGGEPDLVAFLVVRDRSPVPAALAPGMGVAAFVFQVGEKLDQGFIQVCEGLFVAFNAQMLDFAFKIAWPDCRGSGPRFGQGCPDDSADFNRFINTATRAIKRDD